LSRRQRAGNDQTGKKTMNFNQLRPIILAARESTGRNLGVTVKQGQFRLYDFQRVKVNGRNRVNSVPLTDFTYDLPAIAATLQSLKA
jgi:hypothetical protein